MKYSGIGGQAVIEGIMMQNGNDYAIAVRKPDGDIEVKKDTYLSMTKKHKVWADTTASGPPWSPERLWRTMPSAVRSTRWKTRS